MLMTQNRKLTIVVKENQDKQWQEVNDDSTTQTLIQGLLHKEKINLLLQLKTYFMKKIRKLCKGIINKHVPVNITDSDYFLIENLSRAKFKTKDEKVILVENFRVLNIVTNAYKYLKCHKEITVGRCREIE